MLMKLKNVIFKFNHLQIKKNYNTNINFYILLIYEVYFKLI